MNDGCASNYAEDHRVSGYPFSKQNLLCSLVKATPTPGSQLKATKETNEQQILEVAHDL